MQRRKIGSNAQRMEERHVIKTGKEKIVTVVLKDILVHN